MRQVAIKTEDGDARAFEFGNGPSVLFFIDGIGMRPAMHQLGERLGAAGYRVLMPDVFWRAGDYTPPEPKQLFGGDPSVREAWFKLASANASPDKVMRDTKAYLAYLPGPVGITGYCMGGRLSLLTAGTYPDRIAAAAAYHPGGLATDDPDSPHLLASKITAKLFIGAAEGDQHFDAAQQARLKHALDDAHVDYKLEVFPAKHGWVPSDTPVHDAAQAEHHWKTLLELFGAALPNPK
jgi:carboxymethylenebutenolidase